MRKEGLISVIVPIYGVEKYLEECIESILNQTYKQLEVILVDDGSPDRCGEICDRYAQKDSRIIVIHQKNSGAAAARNAGLRIATGEYITFMDSDDYLEPDAYETMLEVMNSNDVDIVHAQIRYIYVDAVESHPCSQEPLFFSTEEYLLRFLEDWTCALSPVKLFRHHVMDGVFYEEGHLIDDEFFTYKAVMNARRIVHIPKVIINYRQRGSSVMKTRSTNERKCRDIFDYLEKRTKDVISRYPALKTPYEDHYADYLMWLATSEMGTKNTVKQMKKMVFRHMMAGKSLFWKKGQRKRALRILSFLVLPVKKTTDGKDGVKQSEHQFFE